MEAAQSPIQTVEDQLQKESSRQTSGIQFPAYGLEDSIAVAKAVHDKGGGYANREQLAAFLGYKSTTNGAFLSRIGAAKVFGLLSEENKTIRLSPLATKILMPESPEEKRSALIDAFFVAPLFKAIYDEYRGRDLPEGLGLKNALRMKFKVIPTRIDLAYRSLYESAETAGFFEAKGNKSQLVQPVVRPSKSDGNHGVAEFGGGDGGGRGGPAGSSEGDGSSKPPIPPAQTRSRDDLQNDYIGTLIEALREKGKAGDMDKELMERIERLLQLKQ